MADSLASVKVPISQVHVGGQLDTPL